MVEKLTSKDFMEKVFDYSKYDEWKYEHDIPAIIDFYADWCGPCKTVSPIIEELSKEYEGKIHFYKIDVENQPELGSLFGIQSIPTILFAQKNDEPQIIVGTQPKEKIKQIIKKIFDID